MTRYFIKPHKALLQMALNVFRSNKLTIYRNQPPKYEDTTPENFRNIQIAWEAYCHGFTWIMEMRTK